MQRFKFPTILEKSVTALLCLHCFKKDDVLVHVKLPAKTFKLAADS